MQVSSNQVDNSYVVGFTQKINSFTLSNSKEFFDILSKNLYSDPLRAVIRKTICNAQDSHIKADKTNIPIKATYDDENSVVQDFGTGIPHEDIPLVYGVFGGSTKVLDDTQTGGFGLGCKAPLLLLLLPNPSPYRISIMVLKVFIPVLEVILITTDYLLLEPLSKYLLMNQMELQ